MEQHGASCPSPVAHSSQLKCQKPHVVAQSQPSPKAHHSLLDCQVLWGVTRLQARPAPCHHNGLPVLQPHMVAEWAWPNGEQIQPAVPEAPRAGMEAA